MVSAIKRKDLKEIVALQLEFAGKDEQAEEFRSATRITTALIDRCCVEQLEETVNTVVSDISILIEAGDKQSLKLAKKTLDENKDILEYKELKKLLKKAKKG